MKQSITTIKRNVIIFAFFSTLCGWIGYVVDKVTGQAHYENIGTEIGSGSLGMLIWLVTPLICTIFLRSFGGYGWKEAGFSINFKNNKKLYLVSFSSCYDNSDILGTDDTRHQSDRCEG